MAASIVRLQAEWQQNARSLTGFVAVSIVNVLCMSLTGLVAVSISLTGLVAVSIVRLQA